MEKLLHERLREGKPTACGSVEIEPIGDSWRFLSLTAIDAKYLADEIERFYIPLPLVDGEPVNIGDMLDFGSHYDEDERVKEVYALTWCNFGEWNIQPLNEVWRFKIDECKRPTHREPDSLEKLHRDMSSAVKGISGQHFDRHVNLDTAEKWIDRLTALMERDA